MVPDFKATTQSNWFFHKHYMISPTNTTVPVSSEDTIPLGKYEKTECKMCECLINYVKIFLYPVKHPVDNVKDLLHWIGTHPVHLNATKKHYTTFSLERSTLGVSVYTWGLIGGTKEVKC